jgi:hypothetical protein
VKLKGRGELQERERGRAIYLIKIVRN